MNTSTAFRDRQNLEATFLNIQDTPGALMPISTRMLTDRAIFDIDPIGSIYSFGSEACRVDHFLSPRYGTGASA